MGGRARFVRPLTRFSFRVERWWRSEGQFSWPVCFVSPRRRAIWRTYVELGAERGLPEGRTRPAPFRLAALLEAMTGETVQVRLRPGGFRLEGVLPVDPVLQVAAYPILGSADRWGAGGSRRYFVEVGDQTPFDW
ncbi:hypothetical protein [Kitasatospora sp. NPDC050543]|uniref:hypothetical protein n=1 Tax=Kitasatospora sp. NPDC050543 TaxID=3364054 RepID=UPI0037A59557